MVLLEALTKRLQGNARLARRLRGASLVLFVEATARLNRSLPESLALRVSRSLLCRRRGGTHSYDGRGRSRGWRRLETMSVESLSRICWGMCGSASGKLLSAGATIFIVITIVVVTIVITIVVVTIVNMIGIALTHPLLLPLLSRQSATSWHDQPSRQPPVEATSLAKVRRQRRWRRPRAAANKVAGRLRDRRVAEKLQG